MLGPLVWVQSEGPVEGAIGNNQPSAQSCRAWGGPHAGPQALEKPNCSCFGGSEPVRFQQPAVKAGSLAGLRT